MPYFQYPDEFPLSSLPPLIRDAVIEAQQITQAPLGLVAASALGAVSLVCQNLIDVCRLNTLRGPVSLFLLTLAESGERKTAVDKLLMEPLYQQEMLLYSRHKNELTTWKNKEELLKAQKKALLSKLNKELRKGADESETLRQLEALQKNRGEKPVRYKFIFNDATTAAIKDQLCGQWRSVGIMSDEAGIIFDGYTLSELPFINKMWDGSVLSVDRKNEPEQMIENARMTLSLMVQPGLFDRYMERKGSVARDSGFLARCLISKPATTQGKRFINGAVTPGGSLTAFHERLMELARGSIEKSSKDERYCLHFSPEAQKIFIDHYNVLEQDLSPSGPLSLSQFRGHVSKKTENIARIAALLQYFSQGEGKISADIMTSAVVISSWYTDEYKKLFALPDESELQLQDARELLDWLIEECRGECPPRVRKNYILQCGPGRFRNRKKLNVLLNILASQLRLSVVQEGKTTYVLLSEINNITLPELNACYSQKLIRWHEQSFGL
ncbi:YfjI family protein [Escherichia coli]|uniref:YfjI family protein n=1 Tax=Escherichia coli TaxID=562 RepID=UPI001E61E1F6|nr:YfjI family protein [Escherichia coli]